MRFIAGIALLAVVGLAAGQATPFTNILNMDACDSPNLPWHLYDALSDAGFVAHNDMINEGEMGAVYHHYSFSNPALETPSAFADGESLCMSGTAYGGFPASNTPFSYCCTDVVGGPAPTPITATGCSGSYTHEASGTTVPITGKANSAGHELVVSVNADGFFVGEGWFTFNPAFDADSVNNGDFIFIVGCGPTCGDGMIDADAGETCDPPVANGEIGECRASCTYCGDGIVQDDEFCDGGPNCNEFCQDPLDPLAPTCVNEFSPTDCAVYPVQDGNADGGIYMRNGLWYDWAPRSFDEGSELDFCAEENTFVLTGSFTDGDKDCEVSYTCTDVTVVSDDLIEARGCDGTLSCVLNTPEGVIATAVTFEGMSMTEGGAEMDCISKYGSAYRCIGWTSWATPEGGEAHGDLVFTPFCVVE